MAASTAVADLGKRLLEASRKGNAEEVRQLMATGAPITTDWVSNYSARFPIQNATLLYCLYIS